MKITVFISILLLFSASFSAAQKIECYDYGLRKGLYVDGFFETLDDPVMESRADFRRSILGNPQKEKALLFFAKENRINYFVLYGLETLFNYGSGDIGLAYKAKLSDFITEANKQGVEIGMAIGSRFRVEKFYPMQAPEIGLVEKSFASDTAWNRLKRNFDKGKVGFLAIEEYRQKAIGEFNRELKEQLAVQGMQGVLGISTLVTEYEYWRENQSWDRFMRLLNQAKILKKRGLVSRVEVYHGRFPDNRSMEGCVKEMTDTTIAALDGLLLMNYTAYPSAIGKRGDVVEALDAFSKWSFTPLDVMPILSAQTDKFIDYKDLQPHEKHLGDIMADGGYEGLSVHEVQSLFVQRFTARKNIKLTGFQWWCYSMFPFMIYSDEEGIDKLVKVKGGYALTDRILNYYPTELPYRLEVYNVARKPFGKSNSTATSGNEYVWMMTNSDFTSKPKLVSGKENKPYLDVSMNGVYYLTVTKNGCKTTSVPVLVQKQSASLTFANSAQIKSNVKVSPWETVQVMVNQDSVPKSAPIHRRPMVSQSNFIHVKIFNTGGESSSGTEQLVLYYSRSTVAINWPNTWHRNTYKPSKNQTVYLGDRINKLPICIPVVKPGDSVLVTVPFLIDGIEAVDFWKQPFGDIGRDYTILARIEGSENKPYYGMLAAESSNQLETVSTNVSVGMKAAVQIDFSRDTESPEVGYSGLIVGNPSANATPIRLSFEFTEQDIPNGFKMNMLQVTVPLKLYSTWVAGGRQGEGVEAIEVSGALPNLFGNKSRKKYITLAVKSPSAWMGSIAMKPKELHEVMLQFKKPTSLSGGKWIVKQWLESDKDAVIGGVSYYLRITDLGKPALLLLQEGSSYRLVSSENQSTAPALDTLWYNGLEKVFSFNNSSDVSKYGTYFTSRKSVNGAYIESEPVIIASNEGQTAVAAGYFDWPKTSSPDQGKLIASKGVFLSTSYGDEKYTCVVKNMWGKTMQVTENIVFNDQSPKAYIKFRNLPNGVYSVSLLSKSSRFNFLLPIQAN